jgi:hypothetical protein
MSSLATDRQKVEANVSPLLMPAAAVRGRMREVQASDIRAGERFVTDLANIFDVGTEAMGYRLINLELTRA